MLTEEQIKGEIEFQWQRHPIKKQWDGNGKQIKKTHIFETEKILNSCLQFVICYVALYNFKRALVAASETGAEGYASAYFNNKGLNNQALVS